MRDSIEQEAGNSASWLKDNRLCVACDKSKLLLIGTRKLRASKLTENLKIVVDDKVITETSSEKLLGVVVNNEITFKNHLYGDTENEGLVQQLARRVGVIKKMSRHMNRKNLSFFASGIFYSKLNYCLPLFGNVLGLEHYIDQNARYQSYTVKDNNKLQVLQNNLNRILLGARNDTPTEVLLNATNSLSVQQMIAFQTAVLAFKITKSGKPSYIARKLQKQEAGMTLRESQERIFVKNTRLTISREGFIHRAAILLNSLGTDLRK